MSGLQSIGTAALAPVIDIAERIRARFRDDPPSPEERAEMAYATMRDCLRPSWQCHCKQLLADLTAAEGSP